MERLKTPEQRREQKVRVYTTIEANARLCRVLARFQKLKVESDADIQRHYGVHGRLIKELYHL